MTTKIDEGGPAYPQSLSPEGPFGGMGLRDYFAATAKIGPDGVPATYAAVLMGEQCPNSQATSIEHCMSWWAQAEAKYRYHIADAMLAARKGGA